MFRTLVMAATLALLQFSPAFAAAEAGKLAPEFAATDIQGNAQSIAQYKGKMVVLEWTNPGCPFVIKHYRTNNMQKLQAYAKEKGVVWLSVNSSAPGKQGNMTPDEARKVVAQDSATPAAYILDPEGTIGHAYGAKSTPTMVVVNSDGVVAYVGAIDDKPTFDRKDVETAKNYVKAAIDELLAGKPVSTPSTKSYGCSVKYKD